MSEPCKIVGPDNVVGDIDWHCRTHDMPAVLIDPLRKGKGPHRRDEFDCPVARIAELEALVERQADAILAVRELHTPYFDVCEGCGETDWPCGTIAALDGGA